ncbi:MAG: flagellar biosynthesis protein FlgM [Planctomycetaceae bacterium]|nr:flagellar biosynthesis protein FlgM [Planctomycetaceae bacterium]
MEIYGPGHIDGPQSIKAPHRVRAAEPNTTTDDVQNLDQVDISAEADLVSQVNNIADVRADRIAEIRAEIEAGTYETDEKLDVAVGKLLDEIG